jgi:hypothetical protein
MNHDLSNLPCIEISLPTLTAQCVEELDNYRRGEPCTEAYGLELLRRATMQGNLEAWARVQQCFGGMVRGWLQRHPQRALACRLESEEHYVAQAFERFWQATAFNQRVELGTLAAALQYLRASLNAAILDKLRASARLSKISRPVPGEPLVEDVPLRSEAWDILKMLLSNPREVRLAYLLFHCGMVPREIVHVCPQEFDDIREVYGLRRTIMERLLCHADQFGSRLIPTNGRSERIPS